MCLRGWTVLVQQLFDCEYDVWTYCSKSLEVAHRSYWKRSLRPLSKLICPGREQIGFGLSEWAQGSTVLKLCLGKQEASAPVLWHIIGRLFPTIQFVSDMPNISTSSTATSSVVWSPTIIINNSCMMAWCVYILQVLHSNNQCGHGVSKTEFNDLKVLHERMVLVGRSPYIFGSGGFELVKRKVLTSKYLQIKSTLQSNDALPYFLDLFGRFYPDNLDSATWNSHSLYPSNLDVVWLIVGRSQAYIYTYNSRGNFHVARLY